MLCRHCGRAISGDLRTCKSCGYDSLDSSRSSAPLYLRLFAAVPCDLSVIYLLGTALASIGVKQLFGSHEITYWYLTSVLYFTLFESSRSQASLGKQLAQLRVVHTYGHPVSAFQAFIRAVLLAPGLLTLLLSRSHLGFHEYFTQTRVIELQTNIQTEDEINEA